MPAQTYPAETKSIYSSNFSAYLAEQSVMDHMFKLIANMDIPGPNEPTTPLYKVLVRKIRSKLRSSGEGMDYLDVEVKARQMARWVEQVAIKAATKSLSNIQARKLITPTNEDIPLVELISEGDEDRDNILVEKLKDSDPSNLPFGRTGESVTLLGKGGKKIMVEGLVSENKKKTLVTKESSDGEIGSWLVEVADKEQIKSIEALNALNKPKMNKNKINLNTERKPKNVDEWKTFADLKQMELKDWKKRIGSLEDKAIPVNNNNQTHQVSPIKNNSRPSNPQKPSVLSIQGKIQQRSLSPPERNINTNEIERKSLNKQLSELKSIVTQVIPEANNHAFKVKVTNEQVGYNPHHITASSSAPKKPQNELYSSNKSSTAEKNLKQSNNTHQSRSNKPKDQNPPPMRHRSFSPTFTSPQRIHTKNI